MLEIATRIDLAAKACDGKLNLALPFAREFCYLQFRRICELIALGCLLLHEDIPATRLGNTKKEWNAQRIFALLRREHPHAFPQSVTQTTNNGVHHFQGNSKPNALTYEECLSLYNKCGELLHRGTIKTIESEGEVPKAEYDLVIAWHRKIVDLLNQHIIAQRSGGKMYLISLKSAKDLPSCSVFTNWTANAVQVESYSLSAREDGKIECRKSAT